MRTVVSIGVALGVLVSGTAYARAADANAAPETSETCRLPGASNVLAFECAGFDVSVGTVFMKRHSTGGVIIVPPTGTPGTILTGDDLDFDREFGPDIYARWRINQGWSVEGRYFGSSSEATHNIPSITTFRIAGIGVTILGSGPIDSTFSSRLQSAEVNVAKEVIPGVSLLAGFRHVGLDENLRIDIATAATYTNWNVQNDLYGGQLGLKLGFMAPSLPLEFSAAFKGGVYHNAASNDFTSTIVGSTSSTATTTAYSGEIDLGATYHFNNHLSIRGGYSSLWLRNVALGDTQAEATVQGGGGTSSPVAFGNVRYDAFSVRASYAF
jgi:hypothetical protein